MLKINDPLLDEMVNEFVNTIHSKVVMADTERGVEIFESYSEKEHKGKHFEIRFDTSLQKGKPNFIAGGREIAFEKVQIGEKKYWVAIVKTNEVSIDPQSFKNSPFDYLRRQHEAAKISFCQQQKTGNSNS